jgi:tetratricopeptide (TPR) repeat protein
LPGQITVNDMAKKTQKKLIDLPQHSETWYFAVRKLRIWIAPEGEEPERPYLSITFNLKEGIIQDYQLGEKPTALEAQETLFSAMRKPQKELKTLPHRPARIDFEDRDLMEALTLALQEIGVETRYRPQDFINQLVKELEEHLGGGEQETPGLLSQRKVTAKLVSNLFNSAAEFYRAAPWVQLQNEDVLSIRLPSQKKPYYAIVMGQGGIEYGLALYKRWEDVERQYLPHDDPEETIPPDGLNSFFFNPINEVPFDDLEAIERYGWEVAGQDAYPVPLVFVPPDEVQRPDRDVLLWYEAALRAIPIFVENHILRDAEGEIEPVEADIPVTISTGPVTVQIKYPAGELPLTRLPEYSFEEMDDDEMSLPFDRRAMEGDMYRMFGMFSDQETDPKLEKAQQIMYEAWEERNPARRIALARKALKTSKDCADAYVLLAEEEADTIQRAYDYYQEGIQAGERVLGEDYFDENAGYFWGLIETRPYMRSLEGAASCLWQMGKKEEALQIYNRMLHLNPGDNQGIRYVLADLLLSLNRERDLEKILKEYENDWSSVWLYTKALLTFRKGGSTEKAKRALQEAMEQNRHVLDYLTGKKRVPTHLPDYIGIGEDTEAASYAANHLNYWRQTPGAVEWLQEISSSSPSVKSTGKSDAGKQKKKKTRKRKTRK